MTRALKILAAVIAGIIVLYFVLISSLSYHDDQTRKKLLRTVTRELPVNASKEQMTEFLRRYTSGFDMNENGYGGFVPQTQWDRFWFDRQVRILFKLNPDGTLRDTEIMVFYTFL